MSTMVYYYGRGVYIKRLPNSLLVNRKSQAASRKCLSGKRLGALELVNLAASYLLE